MLLNTDANYSNMGSYRSFPDAWSNGRRNGIATDHGIAGNMSDIQQMPYRYGDQGGHTTDALQRRRHPTA